ncbi:hypothetical protein BB779_07305 [Pseudomonas viridiflava]|nr:hypothetical protein AO390_13635 [Pseudomonas marginalis ICMP 11289]ODJ91062.1 hypothetical protein BB779_07305 [Pseudomonas viridiflava]
MNRLFVGGGLPATNDDMFFLTYRVDRIAGKPPPTVRGLLLDSATSKTWWRVSHEIAVIQ